MAGRHTPRCLNASGLLTAYDQVTIKKLDATAALETILVAKIGSCKNHLRLVVQAFQPVQMGVEGWCSINDPQFFQMFFIKISR
jgi:hypothetical protein